MKQKLETFVKMLYSNNAILKARKASYLLTFLMFVINIGLISVPNYAGIYQGVEQIDNIHNINDAFSELYEDELSCRIDDAALMTCDEEGPTEYGDYVFRFVDELDADQIDEDDIARSSILFSPREAAVVYVEDAGTADERIFLVSGTYHLFRDFDFSEVRSNAQDSDDPDAYYERTTDMFLESLYYSGFGDSVLIVYTTQFAQMLIYTFFVSLMLLVLNYRAKFKKLTYPASLKITVFSATGPALLTAALGLYITAWASMLFIVLYLVRVILIYYRVNRVEETLT